MNIQLSELARNLGLELKGKDMVISGFAQLDEATASQLSFFADTKYMGRLAETKAGALVISPDHLERAPAGVSACLLSKNPYLDFVRAVKAYVTPQGCFTGHSGLAYIDPSAKADPAATVYPFAFIGAGSEVGAGTTVYAGVYIGEGCRIGKGCVIYPNAVLMADTTLGDGVIVNPGAVIGGDGFGFLPTPRGMEKIPQIGGVRIEDGVEIGSNTTVDRAALGMTKIGRGTKIDNLVMIAHNVSLGDHSVIVAQTGIAGSTKVGKGVFMSGQVGVLGHLEIGDGCRLGAKTGLNKSLPPNSDVVGQPAMEGRKFFRMVSVMMKLPELAKKITALENEIALLKKRGQSAPEKGESES